jgi:hypothetical protein
MTGAVLAGLVAVAIAVGGASLVRPAQPPVDHRVPVATPQVSPDHPAMTTVWRPR